VHEFCPSDLWLRDCFIGLQRGSLHVYDSLTQLIKYGAALINASLSKYQGLCVGALPENALGMDVDAAPAPAQHCWWLLSNPHHADAANKGLV